MQNKVTHNQQDPTGKRDALYKIIEDINTSGQSQINYCKQNYINKDHFACYIACWRKDKSVSTSKPQFVPMGVITTAVQGKLILNVATGINLELPEDI